MKVIKKALAVCAATAALLAGSATADAQYWQAANQLQSLISPALSGSGAYKGFVEVTGLAGIGSSRANHVEFSTSQGYQYRDWFYMGAGIGVDIVHSSLSDVESYPGPGVLPEDRLKQTGVMLPVFSDFRFNIAAGSGTSMYIDVRLGASWLCGSSYLKLNEGWLKNNANFYFRPSVGVRIPVSQNGKQAFNIGVSYLLLTSGNNYWYASNTQTLSAIGGSISFDW